MKSTLILVLLLTVSTLFAIVNNPIIDTDKSTNCYSLKTIVKDLIKPNMTNEEKMDALFSFHRRMVYHHSQRGEDNIGVFEPNIGYNVYGYSYCTQQAGRFRQLLAEVFGTENAFLMTGPDHSSFEVFYDSAWHWVDPATGSYARAEDGHTLSREEIAKTPGILEKAVKAGRVSTPFLPCTNGKEIRPDYAVSAVSYFEYNYEWFNNVYLPGAKHNAAYSVNPFVDMRKNLRQGESIKWLWDLLPGNHTYIDNEHDSNYSSFYYPQRHICGIKDTADHINWKYFAPYKKVIHGKDAYRYAANGVHEFKPNLPKDGLTLSSSNDLCTLQYRIKIPYPIMDAKLNVEFLKKTVDSKVMLEIAPIYFVIGKKTIGYNDGEFTKVDFKQDDKELDISKYVSARRINSDTSMGYGYILNIIVSSNKANAGTLIKNVKFTNIFQHNMFAQPQLEPGDNKVSITSESISLDDSLSLEFVWEENSEKKSNYKVIDSKDFSYTINVVQKEIPKMKYMILKNTVKNPVSKKSNTMLILGGLLIGLVLIVLIRKK